MKVCPECLENPSPQQRDGTKKDGRCRSCLRWMRREKRLRERASSEDAWW